MSALIDELDWPWQRFGFPHGTPAVELGEVVDAYVARASELAEVSAGATAEERERLTRQRAELDEAFDVVTGQRLWDRTGEPLLETVFAFRNARITGAQAQRMATLLDHARRTGQESMTLMVHFGIRDDIDAPWLVRLGPPTPGSAVFAVYENGTLADLARDGLVLDGEESADIGWLVLLALGAAVPPAEIARGLAVGAEPWFAREVEDAVARLSTGDARPLWAVTCAECGRRWELFYRLGVCCSCHTELPIASMRPLTRPEAPGSEP